MNNPVASTSTQISMDFTPGLTERYASLLDCVSASVHRQAKPMKALAAEMDMSPSDLARKLSSNPDDPRRFSVADLESYVRCTGDTMPILYLVQKFCADDDTKKREALNALAALAPQIQALLKAAGGV